MTKDKPAKGQTRAERRRRGQLARERARRRTVERSAQLRQAQRITRRHVRERETVVQISVRLTKKEDAILASMLERGEYVSITEAIRGLIRGATRETLEGEGIAASDRS